jgi:DNA polymerase-3 subunit alpha
MQMGIEDFNDLVVSNALVRPGAMDAIGKDYLKAKRTGRWKSIHPDVNSFMDETFHYPLYQEQLMQLTVTLAGFTMEESNKLRKGLGKKLQSVIDEYRPKFLEGASQKVDMATAERLWKSFEAAGSYMFNKSHAVAYSLLSLKTAWLKYHYPLEYMCALLRNENENDVITDYLLECKAMGIKIKFPHINYSDSRFKIEGDALRMGLSGVKYLSDKLSERIIAAGPFESYVQFKEHVLAKGSGLNTRVLQALNAFGGATFDDNPRREDYRDHLYEYLGIPAFKSSALSHSMKAQIRPLEDYNEYETFIIMVMVKKITQKDNWKRIDVVDSTGTTGIFVSPESDIVKGKMYLMLVGSNSVIRYIDMDDLSDKAEDPLVDFLRRPNLSEVPDRQWLILGAVARKTKAGKNMATLVIADSDKNLKTILVFDSMFHKAKLMARIGATRVITLGAMKDGTEFLRDIY